MFRWKLFVSAALLLAVTACTTEAPDPQPIAASGTAPDIGGYHGPPVSTDEPLPAAALTGGIQIMVGSGPNPARCTAGFPLVGQDGIRFYLIAGHCARGEANAPVFADIIDMARTRSSGHIEKTRIKIGTVTQNLYPSGLVYDPADPKPFPDLAVFTSGTTSWPVPARPLIGNRPIESGGFPADKLMDMQAHGTPFCWPVARAAVFVTECGDVEWVRDNYAGIRPRNPGWAAALGDSFAGTPVWSTDYGDGKDRTVGVMSVRLPNGVFVVNSDLYWTYNRFAIQSFSAPMPAGYVPDPPGFGFPR